MTLFELKRKLIEIGKNLEDPMLEARVLLSFLGFSPLKQITDKNEEVSQKTADEATSMMEKRASGYPMAYITGVKEFWGMEFKVNDNVLIPRPDTETLVEVAVDLYIENNLQGEILDLCTGSGCILLSILKYVYGSSGVGVDISDGALRVAGANSEALGIDATFIKSDMFESIPRDERFDIIVSNPPYIKSNVIETLMSEVKDYEPMSALDGSADGLRFYRIIADRAPEFLNKGGMLFVEIGYDQGEEVSALITEAGFTDVQVIKDLSGLDRVVSGRIGLI